MQRHAQAEFNRVAGEERPFSAAAFRRDWKRWHKEQDRGKMFGRRSGLGIQSLFWYRQFSSKQVYRNGEPVHKRSWRSFGPDETHPRKEYKARSAFVFNIIRQ